MPPARSYTKRHISAASIVTLLESKGLSIPDPTRAENTLKTIGYNRLRIYLLSRRDSSSPGRPFQSGTTFEDIIGLHNLDEELRALVFPYCARIEVTFRNVISETLTGAHGCHPFYRGIFKSDNARQDAMRLLTDVYHRRLNQDRRAKHYFDEYRNPSIPPMWTMKEFFTFEKASKFYNCLDDPFKADIARKMGVSTGNHSILTSWIHAIIDLRNICAHHDRLFNRSFQKQPQNFRLGGVVTRGVQNKLSGILECMDFMGGRFYPSFNSFDRAKALCSTCGPLNPEEVGF